MERFEKEDLNQALETLKNGGVILYPTDTVWGIGCDATNPKAVEKIYEIKNRDVEKSMIVLFGDIPSLERTVGILPEAAEQILSVATTPITIIYDHARGLANGVTASDGTIGARVSEEIFSKTLCQKFKEPIISTSANISGKKAPKIFSEISEEILGKMDYIVKYRQNDTRLHKPSGIIRVKSNNEIKIIR